MFRLPLLASLLCAMLAACSLTRPAPVKHTWLIDAQRSVTPAESPLPGLLLVDSVVVAEAFAGKPMVYRFEDHRYESDFYNEFFVAPRDIIGQRVLEWLQAAQLFETVAPLSGSRARDARRLRTFVNEMYADVRDRAQPTAVLSVQFYIVSENESGKPVRFGQQLRNVAPMRDDSAQAYAEALSQALAAVLAELEKQLRSASL
jgi:cholesterol transport system auxiliary component